MNAPPPQDKLLSCRKCRRLANQLARLRESHPEYWNRPVPLSGPADAKLMIVGLAPGMHGANKTGKAFTGDASGELLYDVLDATGLRHKVSITNAVKCLPLKNLPKASEVNNCSGFLQQEIKQGEPGVVLALGGVAHRAIIRLLGLRQVDYPFGHGAVHRLTDFVLIDSYHCSRYNTQTGRLTRRMFLDVMQSAGNMAYP